MIIYKVTNKINGMIYIGQTVQPLHRRWQDHQRGDKYPDSYLTRAINKHGLASFEIVQVDRAETLEGLNALEEHYIAKFDCLAPKGYNLLPGGNNRRQHPDTRAKLSAMNKGKPITNRWDKGRTGPHSEETKAVISEKLKGRPVKDRYTGGNKTPRTEAQKAHLSSLIKGRPNVSLHKPVVDSNGAEYPSINAAAAHFDVDRVTISGLLKSGKVGRCGVSFRFKKV